METHHPTLDALVATAVGQPPRPFTGADIEALLPLVARFRGQAQAPTPAQMLDALPEVITALAQLLGLERAALASIPVHGLLEIIMGALPAWLDLNARYLTEQVTPRLQGVQQAISAAMPAASGQ